MFALSTCTLTLAMPEKERTGDCANCSSYLIDSSIGIALAIIGGLTLVGQIPPGAVSASSLGWVLIGSGCFQMAASPIIYCVGSYMKYRTQEGRHG